MGELNLFREYTRQLQCQLGNINKSDCCDCGIGTTQCYMLVEIGRQPGLSIKELALTLRTDKSSVSRAIEELVCSGYVERKSSQQDRRWVTLTLTPKGQQQFEKIEHDMNLKFQSVLDNIPVEKQEQVIEALQLYVEACEKLEG